MCCCATATKTRDSLVSLSAQEIIADCPAPEALVGPSTDAFFEDLSDGLLALGALSVSLEDPSADDPQREVALFGEPGSPTGLRAWPISRLRVLLPSESDAPGWWAQATDLLPHLQGLPMEVHPVADDDWVGKTQKQFVPMVLDRLWVGPSWHEIPPSHAPGNDRGAVALNIDPGQAFGTGGHATTQLCLEALLESIRLRGVPASVLDVGTGSGILAIAAARLGSGLVWGEDIDPVAVATAQRNAQANGTIPQCRFCDAGEVPAGTFDLVFANILAQPLRLLAPMLISRTRPGGSLVLSGILERQAEELLSIYNHHQPHTPMRKLGSRDGWVALGFLGAFE